MRANPDTIKITSFICWKRRPDEISNFYLTDSERLELIKSTSFQALAVFELFLRVANESEVWQTPLSNKFIAGKLGLSEAAANKYKNVLIKLDWIHTEKYRSVEGNRTHVWYLGPRAERLCNPI